jgi:hypothetical protein
MATRERISVYDSQSREYHRAFQVFLDHTDQKLRTQEWLNRFVKTLSSRSVFIDAGAGNGKVTSWFVDAFDRTIAIEPNESLRAELRMNCPAVEVIADKILGANVLASGDLVLCSHVFYYIDGAEWLASLERLVSWLSSDGVSVVILQNHETDCMRMLEHFFGRRFDLKGLAGTFPSLKGDGYEVKIETVPAEVVTQNFETAYTIAEFMLNLLPGADRVTCNDLAEYVRRHFSSAPHGFRFSCDQDFLQIRRLRK